MYKSNLGCTDPLYVEYDLDANVDDNSCSDLKIYGCTDPTYLEYWYYSYHLIVFIIRLEML